MKTKTEIIDLIIETFASQAGGQPVLGYKYVIGRTAKDEAIALVFEPEDRNDLTSELLEEIKAEATKAELAKPIHIYAMANGGPNGSPSYCFYPLTKEITGKFPWMAKVPDHRKNKLVSCVNVALRVAKQNACSYIVTPHRNPAKDGVYEVKPRCEYNGSDLINREHVLVTCLGQVNYQQKTDGGWKTLCLQNASR